MMKKNKKKGKGKLAAEWKFSGSEVEWEGRGKRMTEDESRRRREVDELGGGIYSYTHIFTYTQIKDSQLRRTRNESTKEGAIESKMLTLMNEPSHITFYLKNPPPSFFSLFHSTHSHSPSHSHFPRQLTVFTTAVELLTSSQGRMASHGIACHANSNNNRAEREPSRHKKLK